MPVVDEGSVVNWVQGAAALEGLVGVCICCQRGRNVGSVYRKGFLEHFGFLQTHNLWDGDPEDIKFDRIYLQSNDVMQHVLV